MNLNNQYTGGPEREFSILLLRLKRLIANGKGDEDDAEKLRDNMDMYWATMTHEQRQRMQWLSVDLEAVFHDGIPVLTMAPAERNLWGEEAAKTVKNYQAGRPEVALAQLRKGRPADIPEHAVFFLQSRLWSFLGFLEAGVEMMKGAEREDPSVAPLTLTLLSESGQREEAAAKAGSILSGRQDDPFAVYFACVTLMEETRHLSSVEAGPTLKRVREPLCKVFNVVLQAPQYEKEMPGIVLWIGTALGLCLNRSGDDQSADGVYNTLLGRYPREPDVYVMRGISRLESSRTEALRDFKEAIRLGTRSYWPYVSLSRHMLETGDPLAAVRFCNQGLQLPDVPDVIKALFYEGFAMAYAVVGQSWALVLDNFDRALDLDPGNPRIRENREIAARVLAEKKKLDQEPEFKLYDRQMERVAGNVAGAQMIGGFTNKTSAALAGSRSQLAAVS